MPDRPSNATRRASYRFSSLFGHGDKGHTADHSAKLSMDHLSHYENNAGHAGTTSAVSTSKVPQKPPVHVYKGISSNQRRKPPPPGDIIEMEPKKSNPEAHTNEIIEMINDLENEIGNLSFNDNRTSGSFEAPSTSDGSFQGIPRSPTMIGFSDTGSVSGSALDVASSPPVSQRQTSSASLLLQDQLRKEGEVPYPVDSPYATSIVEPESPIIPIQSYGNESRRSKSSDSFRSVGHPNMGAELYIPVSSESSLDDKSRVLGNIDYGSTNSLNNLRQPPSSPIGLSDDSRQTLKTTRGGNSISLNGSMKTMQSMETKKTSVPLTPSHRHSNSINSLWSSNSYRKVNLGSFKKKLDLRPGEGDSSHYVMTIRRNAGTAVNETGPSKWKLPIGIAPLDNRTSYATTNGRYLRYVGAQSRMKKGSGVELKHGHLQPRLLAAEAEQADDSIGGQKSKLARSNTGVRKSNISNSSVLLSSTTLSNESRAGSLKRSGTDKSVTTSIQSSNTESSSVAQSSRRSGSITSSLGSVTDLNMGMSYYQHQGYKYEVSDYEDETDVEGNHTHKGLHENELEDGYEEKPRLVLANPDTSSEEE